VQPNPEIVQETVAKPHAVVLPYAKVKKAVPAKAALKPARHARVAAAAR
jgi:hypothetical protein